MTKVRFNGKVIACSAKAIKLGEVYFFPHGDLMPQYFEENDHHTEDPSLGKANYYHIKVGNSRCSNGACYFPNPTPKTQFLRNYVIFTGRGLEFDDD